MFNAKKWNVYKQDPTVIELEASLAAMFGMEAALFSFRNDGSNGFKITYTNQESKLLPTNMHMFYL
jgi:threonine aldolase